MWYLVADDVHEEVAGVVEGLALSRGRGGGFFFGKKRGGETVTALMYIYATHDACVSSPRINLIQRRPKQPTCPSHTYLESDGSEVVDALVGGALVDHLSLRQEHEAVEELEDRVARLWIFVVAGLQGQEGCHIHVSYIVCQPRRRLREGYISVARTKHEHTQPSTNLVDGEDDGLPVGRQVSQDLHHLVRREGVQACRKPEGGELRRIGGGWVHRP